MTRKILFVDFAPLPGGSVQSLFLLVKHLPLDKYQPVLLLSPTVAALPEAQALSMPIIALDAGQGRPHPGGRVSGQVRASDAAAAIRQSRYRGALWRTGSIARRLWGRTRPVSAKTARIIRTQQIDLVHLNDSLPLAEPGIVAAWRARRPSIVVSRSFAPLDAVHRRLSRIPAAGVFTSESLRGDVERQGAHFRRPRIVPNAVDLKPYEEMPDRDGVRAELGLPQDSRIVAVAGRIMRRKGLDVFIKAMAQVCRSHANAYGLIIGEVDQAEEGLDEELMQLAEETGVGERIRLTGYRQDIPRLLLTSDLLCFVPSEPEPFGRTVIEAMAAGLPVVAANSGALPDIVADGETGLVVRPGDAETQAEAIGRLLANLETAASMGQAGRVVAQTRYSVATQVKQMVDLYDEILTR
ncbi:MAG: glycosyltransferase family 4 protein [Caldilineales bacterium]|nr:glycosyltransferase family 4 protein [Caldilineales bacterium]